MKELQSLIDFAYSSPALSNAAGDAKHGVVPANDAFSGVVSTGYWSSTTYAANAAIAWIVNLDGGYVLDTYKPNNYFVWPVRAGQ